ncbi:MAG TPA: hypothetical protein VKB50_30095 [Vicinamibacterales bacterium]|nr:hypothetical protein [Vicinamibacterales bacterium]
MPPSRLSILMTGMIAADAFHGGATWAVLQYVLGLRQLGHRVCFIEPVPAWKLRPVGSTLARSGTAAHFRQVTETFGFGSSAALLLEGTTETVGLSYSALRRCARRADLLINISGMLNDPALLEPIARRVYLDLDPGFNQAWQCGGGIDMRFDAHTHFATVGLAMGRFECRVPTCGKRWITTCPPVLLREWPVAPRLARDAFTTVANWRSYGAVHHDGMFLGQKAHALRPLIALPRKTRTRFALALAIHPSEPDLAALHQHGWTLVDPRRASGTPSAYRRFVSGSRAEFGIAKSGYVVARSGWFSDRSACYLASGRPVLAHDTGFAAILPTGEGLLSFTDESDVLAGIDAIETDYPRHRKAARAIAQTYLDSDRVLPRLLDEVGATS